MTQIKGPALSSADDFSAVDDAIGYSLGHQLKTLKGEFQKRTEWPDPNTAFAYYVLKGTDLQPSEKNISVPEERLQESSMLASYGYLLGASIRSTIDPATSSWDEHVKRRFEKKIIGREGNSFFFRPYDLLGIALGLREREALESEVETLRQAMEGGRQHYAGSSLTRQLIAAIAGRIVGAEWSLPNFSVHEVDTSALCSMYWAARDFPAIADEMGILRETAEIRDQVVAHSLRSVLVHPRAEIQDVAVTYYALSSIVEENIERLHLGFRNASRKKEAAEREERLETLARKVEQAKSWITRRRRYVEEATKAAITVPVTLILIPVELYLVGVLGSLDDPFSLTNLPAKLWEYANDSSLSLFVVAVLSGAIAFGIYRSDWTSSRAENCGVWYEEWLLRRVLGGRYSA